VEWRRRMELRLVALGEKGKRHGTDIGGKV
jgi:hypothetical protein